MSLRLPHFTNYKRSNSDITVQYVHLTVLLLPVQNAKSYNQITLL